MKIALITGAGIRVGKGIAKSMLEAGYHLILHANSSFSKLEYWSTRHKRKDQILALIRADISTSAGQKKLVGEVKKRVCYLDSLIHNASIYNKEPFSTISKKNYRNMQAINIEAPFFITQALLPLLRQSSSASVINIIDAVWDRPSPFYAHYFVSKAGLAILTKALAKEIFPIRVNAVAPGAILFSPMVDEKTKVKILQKIPLKRNGKVNEIAHAVLFLLEKTPLSGEIVVVDGGRSLVA